MVARNEATASRRSRHLVAVLLLLLVVQTFSVVANYDNVPRRSTIEDDSVMMHWRQRRTPGAVRDGPPIKPEHFRSVAELNKYLADLNEYYTVLGRPRFGKRGVQDDYDDDVLLNEARALSRVNSAGRYRRAVVRNPHKDLPPSLPQQQQQQQRDDA